MSQAIISNQSSEIKKTAMLHSSTIHLIGMILFIIMLGATIWTSFKIVDWTKKSYLMPISKLIITGERNYTTDNDICQAILKLGIPGNFITQDIDIIHNQIKNLPWIKQVSVRKQWPDKLRIHLIEYVPVAHWNNEYLLDGSGTLFTVPKKYFYNNQLIPALHGPEGSEKEVLNGYLAMNVILISANFHIKSINMSARHSWQLTLLNDIQLRLGRDDLIRRLKRFISVYPVLFQQARKNNKYIKYVDLRYDSGLAVNLVSKYLKLEHNN